MHSHNSADVAGQIAPTGSESQILRGIEPIGVDHKVAVFFVDGGRLASVASIKELRQTFSLDGVDVAEIKPGRV